MKEKVIVFFKFQYWKEIFIKICRSIFKFIYKLQYPSIYLSFVISVLLILFSIGLLQAIKKTENGIDQVLIDFDNFMNITNKGMNEFIQDTPSAITNVINNMFIKGEQEIQKILDMSQDVTFFFIQSMIFFLKVTNSLNDAFNALQNFGNILLKAMGKSQRIDIGTITV